MSKPVRERWLSPALFYGLAATLAIADQLTKQWVIQTIPVGQQHSVPLIRGVFHLTHVQNRGIAFSLLEGKMGIITIAAIVVMSAIVVTERKSRGQMPLWQGIALALPLGGALGNLIDRLHLGYVTDFLDATIINFPVFNLADTCITIGIALLAFRTLVAPQTPVETERAEADEAAQWDEIAAGRPAETNPANANPAREETP